MDYELSLNLLENKLADLSPAIVRTENQSQSTDRLALIDTFQEPNLKAD